MVGRFLRNRRYRYRIADGSESRPYPTITGGHSVSTLNCPISFARHCEERSDEATQSVIVGLRLGCFVLLRSPRNDE